MSDVVFDESSPTVSPQKLVIQYLKDDASATEVGLILGALAKEKLRLALFSLREENPCRSLDRDDYVRLVVGDEISDIATAGMPVSIFGVLRIFHRRAVNSFKTPRAFLDGLDYNGSLRLEVDNEAADLHAAAEEYLSERLGCGGGGGAELDSLIQSFFVFFLNGHALGYKQKLTPSMFTPTPRILLNINGS